MEFKDRLTNLRKKSKLYQVDMAKKIGVARATYGAYEQGTRQPDFETLQTIADFFEVSTDYLLGRTDNPYSDGVSNDKEKSFFMSKIATEFPDIDLMFRDMESMNAEEMKDVYEYIKFKKSQKSEE